MGINCKENIIIKMQGEFHTIEKNMKVISTDS